MFEQYVGIDWSGAKSPHKSYAVSLACCHNGVNPPTALTTKLSRSDVYEWIAKQIRSGTKTLIGIDCNLGYAAHVARQQLGQYADYWALWSRIEHACTADENFFAGKWWQSPEISPYFWQNGKQPPWFDLQSLRRQTEHCAVAGGFGNPESPFKLIGATQVGKGGLAGMRVMHKLKTEFADAVAVWPFEAHAVDKATVVMSENFPRLFIRKAGFGNEKVRDLNTLNTVLGKFDCRAYHTDDPLNDHLTDAIIASAGMRWVFHNEDPLSVSNIPAEAVLLEGWIFGVSPNDN